jgi:hypothetical protein
MLLSSLPAFILPGEVGEGFYAGPLRTSWRDANSHRRCGSAETGVYYLACHQPSSGMANFVSFSSHGRSVVLTFMSVILMVRRSFGSGQLMNLLATSG